ncbi:MAG: tetratricopeptide repeat protein [Gallionella sp.]
MGIFDRFRAVAPSVKNSALQNTSEQDATHLIEEGHALEAEGKLTDAMQHYLDAIPLAKNPARAHLNLGNILLLKGDLNGALDAFSTAIKLQPDYAGAYYNIGHALLGNGQLDEAAASYRRALEIQPDYAEVHCSLGVVLKDLGQLDDAVGSFQMALKLKPDLAEAHTNLDVAIRDIFIIGNMLMGNGQFEGAVANFRRVLEIKPDYAEAHTTLGMALTGLGQFEGAAASYRHALEIKPDLIEAQSNLGVALQELGQFENAAACYQRALKIEPNLAEAHSNLGVVLQELGQLEAAVASCWRALKIKADYAEAHYNLGNVLKDLGQLEAAMTSYRCALAIKPDYAVAHNNLGNVLQELGQLDNAVASYHQALELKPDYANAHSNLLLVLNYTANHTPEYYLEQARQYGRSVAKQAGARFSAWPCSAQPERLRIGLMSGDFRKHSVGYFLDGLLAYLDPARIELIAYPTHHEEDELTTRIRQHFSAWQPLFNQSDEATARLIHSDSVHVLIDLSGHTQHNRLPVFAWKPAPVQVTWLGLPTTTGVAEIDYVLGDLHAIPMEFNDHFSESVWRMPDSYLCLTVPDSSVTVATLPALSAGYVTFGSFNNLTKMTNEVVAVWARVLKSVPNSRLFLKTKQLSDPAVCEKTRQRFAACGIASEQLILGGILASRDDHLAAYNSVDIALDTFPYPGVTTSVEALWMGVPVLSKLGDRFISRTAGSIAHNAGLPDWIAADEDEYVAKAVAFSSNLDRLAALRAGLRQQVLASPLFDAPRFARNFEDALWGMWDRYQTQQGNLERMRDGAV